MRSSSRFLRYDLPSIIESTSLLSLEVLANDAVVLRRVSAHVTAEGLLAVVYDFVGLFATVVAQVDVRARLILIEKRRLVIRSQSRLLLIHRAGPRLEVKKLAALSLSGHVIAVTFQIGCAHWHVDCLLFVRIIFEVV